MRFSDWSSYVCSSDLAASGNALNVDLLEGTLGALEGDPAKYLDSFFRAGDGLDEGYKMKNEAFSIFGIVDFDVTDRLMLTLGGNYTKDRKRFSTNVVSSAVFSGVNLDAAAYMPFRQALLATGSAH